MRSLKRRIQQVWLLPIFSLVFSGAHAQTADNWTGGGGSTNFNSGTNWSLGTVPGTSNNAVFAGATPTSVKLSSTATIKELSFTSGAYTLSGAALTIDIATAGSANGTALVATTGGTTVIDNSITLADSTATTPSSVNIQYTISGGSTLTFDANSTFTLQNFGMASTGGLLQSAGPATWNILGTLNLGAFNINFNSGFNSALNVSPISYSGTASSFLRTASSIMNVGTDFGTDSTISYTIGGSSTSNSNLNIVTNGIGIHGTVNMGATTSGAGFYTLESNVAGGGSTTVTKGVTLFGGTNSGAGVSFNELAAISNNTLNINGTIAAGNTGNIGALLINQTFAYTGTSGSATSITSGTVNLKGASTYTQNTTILGGTLLVNNTTGSATGTGSVTGSATTTTKFGGNGTISGTLVPVANLMHIAPGTPTGVNGLAASTGTLNLTGATGVTTNVGGTNYNLALNATSGTIFDFNVNGASAVSNIVTGTNTGTVTSNFTGNLQFNIINLGGSSLIAGVTYTLISDNSFGVWNLAGQAAPTISFALPTGFALDPSYNGTGYSFDSFFDTIQVQFLTVPEPSPYALLAVGLLVGLGLSSRRARRLAPARIRRR